MATIRFLRALVIERRAVRLPVGLSVGDPECFESPANCCGSGPQGQGCCWPAPPQTLYATRYASSVVGCPPLCVPLVYSLTSDAWYSDDLCVLLDLAPCGLYLRLKCEDSAYTLHVVDDTDGTEGVIVTGVLSSGIDDSCDPFVVARDFHEIDAGVCEPDARYSYAVVEGDCAGGGGGSGPGGGGLAPCNPGVSTHVLTVTNKTGGCTCLPDVMDFSGVTPGGPGNNGVWSTHSCEGNPNWFLDCTDGYYVLSTSGGGMTPVLVSYVPSPFALVYDVTITGGNPCTGTARVTITSSD